MSKKIRITDSRIGKDVQNTIKQLPKEMQDICKRIAILQFHEGAKCVQGMCAGIADLDPETITEYGVSHFSDYGIPG